MLDFAMAKSGKVKILSETKRVFYILVFIRVLFFISAFPLHAQKIFNPKPKHFEKLAPKVELEVIKEISGELESDILIIRPRSLTVDDRGYLHIYDSMFKKIFIFNDHFKFVKSYARQGQGPGEFNGNDLGRGKLYFSGDGLIYAGDAPNYKIMGFTKSGTLKKEIRLERNNNHEFHTVVDAKGNYYVFNPPSGNGIIDMYNAANKKVHTFLSRDRNEKFAVYEPKHPGGMWPKNTYTKPTIINTYYDVLPGNRLIVYLANPSTIFIFNEKKLEKQFSILPESGMAKYKKTISETLDSARKRGGHGGIVNLLDYLFIDRDDEKYFYLNSWVDESGRQKILKFNLSGDLVQVLLTPPEKYCRILAKKNNLFLGEFKGRVWVYRTKNTKNKKKQ